MPRQIVIIGASLAGVSAAKAIISLNEAVDLTIISPSLSILFPVALPRVLAEPELIDKVFLDVAKRLAPKAKENGHKFTFIEASVQSVDMTNNQVSYSGKESGLISYDNLVIATGTSTKAPFKLDNHSSHNDVRSLVLDLAEKCKASKTIAVVGGGATGIEVAGELGFKNTAKVTLIMNTGKPLVGFGDSASNTAKTQLEQLGVDLMYNKHIKSEENGKVIFDDGNSQQFDLVIQACGYTPNTQFLDNDLLDSKGYVKVDESLRIPGHKNIFVIGDVVSGSWRSIIDISFYQEPVLKSWIKVAIQGSPETKLRQYKKPKSQPIIVVPISKKGGVMYAYGLCLPNFVVRYLKALTFMIEKFPTFV